MQFNEVNYSRLAHRRILFAIGDEGLRIGGVNKVVLKIITNLNKKYSFIVSTNGAGDFSNEISKINQIEIVQSRLFKGTGYSLLTIIILNIIASFKIADKLKNKNIELIHAHSRSGIISGCIISWLLQIPIVIHMHDFPRHLLMYKLLVNVTKKTVVVAISQAVASHIKKTITGDVRIIYNGVSIKEKKVYEKIINENNNFPVVGILGQIEPWKGHTTFLLSAKYVSNVYRNCKFVSYGEPFSKRGIKYYKKLLKIREMQNLRNVVEYFPYQKNVEDKIELMDIVVVPSIAEPFGLVVLEAFSKGKPVIATKYGGPQEVILNENNGFLIDPKSPEELGITIIKIAKKIKQDNLAYMHNIEIAKNYSEEKFIRHIDELYSELLS